MRAGGGRWALAATSLFFFLNSALDAFAQNPRRTPIVAAVEKTRNAIVAIKVEKRISESRYREDEGTGVVVDERGFIVTNHHLVRDCIRVKVLTIDGTDLAADVVAIEPQFDLAILRTHPKRKFQPVSLASGTDLMVGETVIAIGHPYGYRHSVTTGIISALNREVPVGNGAVLKNLIQINASINLGNSGGPLLNINGELIGINCAYREGAQGIAFAINSEDVKRILGNHLSARQIAGLDHGLKCAERDAGEGTRRPRVVVEGVAAAAPAQLAGFEKGDEIVQVADRTVHNSFDVERALWDHRPGDKVVWTIIRAGKELSVPMTLRKQDPK